MLDDTSHAWLDAITAGDHDTAGRLTQLLDTTDQLDQLHRDDTARLGEAAHGYADCGFPVFPIKPHGKTPLTAHGFKDATVSHARIAEWWSMWPDANIGLPTGTGFDVIDIDGREGLASMYNGERPIIDSVTILAVALTSRPAGRHIYVPATGLGNKASIYPGVDYRGTGGYVVAPPSIGANQQRYTWTRTLDPVAA